ncbi:hypothetical protein ACS0TY_032182 [Phlomoides rotata]
MANLNGATTDLRTTFLEVYSVLKSELLNDPAFEWTDGSRQWVERKHYSSITLRRTVRMHPSESPASGPYEIRRQAPPRCAVEASARGGCPERGSKWG